MNKLLSFHMEMIKYCLLPKPLEINPNKTPSKTEEIFQNLLIKLKNEHEFNTNSLSDKIAELIKNMILNDLSFIKNA